MTRTTAAVRLHVPSAASEISVTALVFAVLTASAALLWVLLGLAR